MTLLEDPGWTHLPLKPPSPWQEGGLDVVIVCSEDWAGGASVQVQGSQCSQTLHSSSRGTSPSERPWNPWNVCMPKNFLTTHARLHYQGTPLLCDARPPTAALPGGAPDIQKPILGDDFESNRPHRSKARPYGSLGQGVTKNMVPH